MAMFRWTKEDDQLIKDNQHLSGPDLARLFPNRTPAAVTWRKSKVLGDRVFEAPEKPKNSSSSYQPTEPIQSTPPNCGSSVKPPPPGAVNLPYIPSTIQIESIKDKCEAARAANGTYKDPVVAKPTPWQQSSEIMALQQKISFLEGKLAGIELILQHLREVSANG